MATPNPLYFACFPLQEYFVNKDTGFPLAGGYVEFFSDPAFTVPKDVFQQSLVGGTTYTYTNLGSVLVLSSVGTFVDNNGDDIIPFLYPYDAQGDIELYFVRVWSSNPSVQGSVLQFTRQGWPPNLIQSTSPSDIFESSLNLFTNPQFSIVNFNNTSGQTYYEITVAGAGNFEFAPGWSIYYAGAGSLKIGQYPLSADWPTNPSYYLEIISDETVSPITLRQRLDKSPRVFENNYLSVGMLAACANRIAEVLTIDYVVNGGTSRQVLSGTVPNNATFGLIAGVANAPVYINLTNNTAPDTGYVEMQVSVPSGRTMRYTSMFGCTVQNATSLVSGSQSTNAQQTNGMFWYYKPQLEYKPIPSYTLGWDFAMNPFQAQGTAGVTYNPTSPGKSAYVADQTLLFQSTVNTTTVSQVDNRAIKLAVATNPSSLALVQYLGAREAQELLNNPVCSQLRAKVSTGTLKGQIRLYYTVDATLPVMADYSAASPVGGYTLVSAVDNTTGAPTVGGGGNYGTWIEVTRDTLGAANFTLSSTMSEYGFAGWNESAVAGINNAKFFAIVVSFAQVPVSSNIEIEHISLQKGYITTAPAAMSFGETLAGLQQYYEKSYDVQTLPATNTTNGALIQQLSGQMYYSVYQTVGGINYQYTCLPVSNFEIRFIVSKRSATNIVTIYSPDGSVNRVLAIGYNQGVLVLSANQLINTGGSLWTELQKGQNGVVYTTAVPGGTLYTNNQSTNNPANIQASILNGYLNYQYVCDARYGIV